MEIKLEENERIDDLEFNGLKIIQNKDGFCFGIDSVLLSDFAKKIKNGARVIDLGTGTGIIGILLCAKTNLKEIKGIEIQEDVANMAKRSVIMNNLEDKFEIINDNIKNIKNIFNENSFDVVVSNPPYKKENSGIKNENEKKLVSRHEITANLNDFLSVAKYLLKDKGELYLIHRPERLVDLMCLLRKNKLEPKILRLVYSNKNSEPKLILIKAIKNAGEFLKVEKPLIIYNEDGTYTDEILKIYNK